MKSSEILRRAARMVERGKASTGCAAILYTAPCLRAEVGAMEYFRRVGPLYPDEGVYVAETWWGGLQDKTFLEPQHMNARIIGLCLAAAIAESEGD